ncbi:hypothetical protein ACSW8S_16410 (plasmid) [Clostridium perfringens]
MNFNEIVIDNIKDFQDKIDYTYRISNLKIKGEFEGWRARQCYTRKVTDENTYILTESVVEQLKQIGYYEKAVLCGAPEGTLLLNKDV